MPGIVVIGAQLTFGNNEAVGLVYVTIGLLAALMLAIVFWRLLRGKGGRRSSLELDQKFISALEGLTDEEKKRVREAMVRQAMQSHDAQGEKSVATLSDLQLMTKGGFVGPGGQEKTNAVSLAESENRRADKGGGGVDLDAMHKKGLIDEAEYERLKRLNEQAQDDEGST